VISAAVIEYIKDQHKVKSLIPAHRTYLRSLRDSGQLLASGPIIDNAGAMWVLKADTREKADEMVQSDPYNKGGVFVKWELISFLYYSARANKAEPPTGHRGAMP
jgi:uncharacterized protein YciI